MYIAHISTESSGEYSDWSADERHRLKLEQTWREIIMGNYNMDNHPSTPLLIFLLLPKKTKSKPPILAKCLMSLIRRPRTKLLAQLPKLLDPLCQPPGQLAVKDLMPMMRVKILKVSNLVGIP